MAVQLLTGQTQSRRRRAIAEELGLVEKSAVPSLRRPIRIKRFGEDNIDFSQLDENAAAKYSQLLGNASMPVDGDNTTTPPGLDKYHLEPYDFAIIYDSTEFTLTNLLAFQEYSIEVRDV